MQLQMSAVLIGAAPVRAVGEVPLEWYKAEEHIGYDVDGRPLARRPRPDRYPPRLVHVTGPAD